MIFFGLFAIYTGNAKKVTLEDNWLSNCYE